jgi:leucyl-tRNA synthetase
LRFPDSKNGTQVVSEEAQRWLPVDLYVGGQEHAVLHLLYARFWHKFLCDIRVVDHSEPFIKLVHQGMILGSDGEKMSKSRGNVVNPDEVVLEHGADALRLYEMFMGPLEATKPWQTSQFIGVVRFRDRVYNLLSKELNDKPPKENLLREMHKTIKKVSEDIEKLSFNTVISSLMVYTNTLTNTSASEALPREAFETLLKLLSPIAPHVAEECWKLLGHSNSISKESWPLFKEELCEEELVTVTIQVNGKHRGEIKVNKQAAEDEVLQLAFAVNKVKKFIENKTVLRKIYVPGRIVNIVLSK